MSAVLDDYRPGRHGATLPTIARWIVLSLLVHLALLLWNPPLRKPGEELQPPPLTAYLRPAPQAENAPPPALPPEPQETRETLPTHRVPLRPVPKPTQPRTAPVPAPPIALAKPTAPDQPSVAVPAPAPPKVESPPLAQTPQLTTPPPAETDFTAALEARRRARGEVPADTPSPDVERANRGALASAALKPSPPVSFETKKPPAHHGGLFQIRRRGYDYAEFMFYGWNENFRRDALQQIEVRKGNHSDIDIAVIREIIGIIRQYEREDFSWYSKRLGRSLTLSARARDNSGLEEFMMQEFQEDLHRFR
jgi:hypothetical protein